MEEIRRDIWEQVRRSKLRVGSQNLSTDLLWIVVKPNL